MIYIVYTTKAKKEQHKFNLSHGTSDFECALRKSSIARFTYGPGGSPPSLDALVKGGVNVAFEATTPEDEAFVKIIPHEKSIFDISLLYHKWQHLKESDPSLYQAVEANLINGKYKNAVEMFCDIREAYKNSATSMISFYSPMQGKSYPYHYDSEKLPQEVLYENIEQIESAIQNEYAFKLIPCKSVGYEFSTFIIAGEYHADLAKKYPLVRLDLYCNKNLTQQEINDLKVERFKHGLDIDITTSLPEYEMGVRIQSESIFTEDEVNKKYFGI